MLRGIPIGQLDTDTHEQDGWEQDSRYLLVRRILATRDFMRSPQLSKFLLYICTATFSDPNQNLSEQHIGVAVFGREPDYDSAADTIVRSHALRLRRRLEQYFQQNGRDEPIHLIIPRGSYAPSFLPGPQRRSNVDLVGDLASDGTLSTPAIQTEGAGGESLHEESEEENPTQERPAARRPEEAVISSVDVLRASPPDSTPVAFLTPVVWRYRFLTGILLLLFVSLAVMFGIHLRSHFRMDRRHILWGRLFTEDQPTQIVLGDSGLVLFHAVTRQHVSLQDYLGNDYSKQMPFVEHVEPKFAQFLLHRRYTSVVDATTLAHLLHLPEAIPERTLVHYSRDMHIEDFNSDNVIMIGAQEAVPWVELFENHMDFVFSINNPDRHASFLNRRRSVGEPREYSSNTPATGTKVYGVIAFLPNLRGTGNVLILEGLSMVGTEAAIDLAIDDDKLLPILKGIRRQDGSLPHFEMLLESDSLGEGAGPARIVALHLHD
jgi:hypothetical protein